VKRLRVFARGMGRLDVHINLPAIFSLYIKV
jgi:hypothetical protein